jgi:hypothetical protein
MTGGEISVSKLRNVEISDLLGREQVSVNLKEVAAYIEGKVVLVTGGGGSIGSELCRQIAMHNPKELIILNQEEGVAIQFGTSGALTMNYVAGEISAEVNGNEITINIPEVGLYFIGNQNPFANENEMIEIVGKINKVLDPKYLPMDAIDARINEVISTALEGEY